MSAISRSSRIDLDILYTDFFSLLALHLLVYTKSMIQKITCEIVSSFKISWIVC